MIQVVERTFSVIKLLSLDNGVSLDALAKSTGINKGTLCNILKTLVELGYVEKSGTGSYLISKNFYALSYPQFRKDIIRDKAEICVKSISDSTKESCAAAKLTDEGEIEVISQAQFKRGVMVNVEVYTKLSLYHSVTGRILLAYSDEKKLKRIVDIHGYPKEEWDNIDSWKKLQKAIEKIRKDEIAIMENKALEIKAFAVPVVSHKQGVCLSLGLTVPLMRMDEKLVLKSLRENQSKLKTEIESI
jgi:DNA-binding IclR family transcriptional regulator